ncbi:hypothetical protein ACFL6C_13190, partial [Myxococcota bacterium]
QARNVEEVKQACEAGEVDLAVTYWATGEALKNPAGEGEGRWMTAYLQAVKREAEEAGVDLSEAKRPKAADLTGGRHWQGSPSSGGSTLINNLTRWVTTA